MNLHFQLLVLIFAIIFVFNISFGMPKMEVNEEIEKQAKNLGNVYNK